MSEYIVNLDGELGMALAVACAGAGFAREEIVRCRDCQHATGMPEQLVCKMPCGDATASRAWCHPDGFCAWGERRTE